MYINICYSFRIKCISNNCQIDRWGTAYLWHLSNVHMEALHSSLWHLEVHFLTCPFWFSSLHVLSTSPQEASYGMSAGTMRCRTSSDRCVRTVFRWRQWASPNHWNKHCNYLHFHNQRPKTGHLLLVHVVVST